MFTDVGIIGKRVVNIKEKRAYKNVCSKLGHLVLQLLIELRELYGSDIVYFKTVRCNQKKFLFDTGTANVSKIRKKGKCDANT